MLVLQHCTSPRPGIMGKKGHVLWLQQTWSCDQLAQSEPSAKPLSANVLLANFYTDQFQPLGEASPKLWQTHLPAMGTAFQLICKFFLSVLHPTGEVTGLGGRCGVQLLNKVTAFSRLGVLVNPYPFGMVITVNQNRKNSQKAQFCLPSQQYVTHAPEKACLKATMQLLPYEFDFLTASNKVIKPSFV